MASSGPEQRGSAVTSPLSSSEPDVSVTQPTLRSGTQGRTTYTMQFDSYEPVLRNVADEVISKAGGNA